MPRTRKPAKPKISEADLCREFITWAALQGWTAYAETGGFDLVLAKDGVQIGVQAKLRFNATLLRQIIPGKYSNVTEGPDYLAILLPDYDSDVRDVADFCGFAFFHRATAQRCFTNDVGEFSPRLEPSRWHHWYFEKPVTLPDYVPDVSAGASAPRQLSVWKVNALRICAVIELQGFVETKDFRRFGIDYRRWEISGWLVREHLRKPARYTAGPKLKFAEQHPTIYKQVIEDLRKDYAT